MGELVDADRGDRCRRYWIGNYIVTARSWLRARHVVALWRLQQQRGKM